MAHQSTHDEQVKKVADLMKDVKIAMLTTSAGNGGLHSRPMGVQQVEFDGDLWFFASRSSRKAAEIRQNSMVNVAFSKPDDQTYVSVSGHAELVDDQGKTKELWNPLLKAWFPKGIDDPDLTLIKIEVDGAEYWDSPSSAVVTLFGFVKSLATGSPPDIGENERVDLRK